MARTITRAGARLDVGRQRSHNEDDLRCRQAASDEEARQFGDLFVLADGMGGHAAGEVASQLAIETIVSAYYSQMPTDVSHSLIEAIIQANQVILAQSAENHDFRSMGTTCVCSAIHGDKLHTAHVGDSRAYLLRDGLLEQITQDHSWVQEQVSYGILTAEEARNHPMKNIITRALGNAPEVQIDLSAHEIREGNVLLICSDGLTAVVDDRTIGMVLSSEKDPQVAVDTLVDMANAAGGPDNIGIIAVRVERVVPVANDGRRPAEERRAKKGLFRLLPFL